MCYDFPPHIHFLVLLIGERNIQLEYTAKTERERKGKKPMLSPYASMNQSSFDHYIEPENLLQSFWSAHWFLALLDCNISFATALFVFFPTTI
jgi:hypothetical protein